MADSKQVPVSKFVEGLQVPGVFSEEVMLSAIHYKPRPDDVILVTYPKCGTTWSQHILSLILRKGVPTTSSTETFAIAPFLEMAGAAAAHDMPRPGVIKTHLPFHLAPYSPEAKYIYVTRNPKDCCVSYFYHVTNFKGPGSDVSFDDFFELFVTGKTDFGDYFDHVLKWYQHRNDPNVLFVTYEEMKADRKAAVMKFASFLGKQYVDLLNENPKILDDILHYSSYEYMKGKVTDDFEKILAMDEDVIRKDPHIPNGMKPALLKIVGLRLRKGVTGDGIGKCFVRKGIVGDWRNHFTAEQNKRMDERISQKLEGNELLDLWKDSMQHLSGQKENVHC